MFFFTSWMAPLLKIIYMNLNQFFKVKILNGIRQIYILWSIYFLKFFYRLSIILMILNNKLLCCSLNCILIFFLNL